MEQNADLLSSGVALAAVLDSVECGILLFGGWGELLAANDRLTEMLGIDLGRLRELGNFEAVVACVAPQFAGWEGLAVRWNQRFQADEASWDTLEMLSPVRKVIERFARPVFGRHAQRLGWIEIYRDVTVQRLVETKKLFHTDRMTVLGQLVSSVAHELNNPLTSILGYAQLLFQESDPGPGNKAEKILEQAERASRITKNLLLFARETKSGRARVDLNEVVERTMALRSYDLRLGNIQVKSDLDPDLPLVLADAAQMQQVVLNLLLNAEQALRPGGNLPDSVPGVITLRTRRAVSQRVVIEVNDNGPGIPIDVLPRIFDAFFTTKPPGMGTGLGLSIIYGILQEHGGEVLVESRLAEGTTFRVLLPMAVPLERRDPLRKSETRAYIAGKIASTRERRSQRILVVEDEPTVALLIADVLGEEGHVVDMVLDSREGLAQVLRTPYDLVICDLRMPHLDGRGFYRELLRHDNALARRLLFVTGDTLAARTVDFLEKSQVPYLAKPFLVEELKEAVYSMLAGASRHMLDSASPERVCRIAQSPPKFESGEN